jgi:hypothetical protein
MHRLERRIPCQDDKGRRYVVEIWRDPLLTRTVDGVRAVGSLERAVLAGQRHRVLTPLDDADTFRILDDDTVLRPIARA